MWMPSSQRLSLQNRAADHRRGQKGRLRCASPHGILGDAYTEHGVFRRGETAASALLDGFSVRVDEVFDAS
jgi:hypothetical protein